MIIAITGTPGTGKTTIAKLLAEKLGFKYIDLNQYLIENKLYEGYDEIRESYVIDEEKLKEIKFEENVVIDSHLSHFLDADIIILLRCDPNELKKRLEEKGYPFHKVFENVWAENLGIIKDEIEKMKKKYIEIDTTNKKPEEIIEEIVKKLNFK